MEVIDYITEKSNWQDLRYLQPIVDIHGKNYQLKGLEAAKQLIVSEMAATEEASFSSADFREAENLIHSAYALIEKEIPQIREISPKFCLISRSKESTLPSPWNGLSAFACGDTVYSFIFPKSDWRKVLELNAIHELHHVIRYKFSLPHESFLDWLTLEGLAGLFELEIKPTEHFMQSWTAIPEATLLEFLPRVRRFWTSPGFMRDPSHSNGWFFGSKKLGVPNSFGYNLGIWLVKKARAGSFQGYSWNELIKVPSVDLVS